MSGCVLAGTLVLALNAGGGFSLDWTHSVERQAWHEDWRVVDGRLNLVRAGVKGSGAGMEPGPGGRFEDGWWVWQPELPPLRELVLAASGETFGGWTFTGAETVELGAAPGAPLVLTACAQ